MWLLILSYIHKYRNLEDKMRYFDVIAMYIFFIV